ncbi:MAG: hypothetical protein FWD24_00905 [Treponema sp.]|nr:hypothetical protein [Treponema sp.]
MTITQTVEILADRKLSIEIPRQIPIGKAQVQINVIPFIKKEEKPNEVIPLLALRGSCKNIDTMDAYFSRKRTNKMFENGQIKENPYKIKGQ